MNSDGTGNQPSYGPDGQWGAPAHGDPQQGGTQYDGQQAGPPQYPSGDPWAQPHGQAQPGYAQPGYAQPGYSQPGYAQPGYVPPAPGWGAPAPDVKVGIIPLRPLDLGAIYSGAVAAIRTNPGVMVGVTAVFLLVTELIVLLAQVPMTRIAVDSDAEDAEFFGDLATATGLGFGIGLIAGIATLFLTGVLTVAVARAVMGERTTVGVAVRAIGPRLPSLIGLSLLQFLIFLVPTAVVVGLVVLIGVASGDAGPLVAVLVAFVLFLVLVVGYLALLPTVSLSYPAVVLEHLGPIAALKRGYELQKPGFWRVLGVLLLTYLITGIIAIVVSIPSTIVAAVVDGGDGADTLAGLTLPALAVTGVGSFIAQLLTVPFLAGVQTLLYVDQRMRNEQFDQPLRDEAIRRWRTGAPGVPTDALWVQKPQAAPSSWY
ncbi:MULTISPECIES: hypothetical protein [Tsukamurella]|uniref:DUF7847 domain-containing protein n=2 Tax=Tsukamurella TaxID=2060 RepID=A0A5C5RSL4_9ACTN|nr:MULTISPECIES: hypothetical protein [Tsukamurella]NMD55620.1 hypothetical protein [Tsukamurella columbiensis]TWS25550.1 hypothetical protein FK530_22785 [Tsukamurella conjunctivitidis]